MNCNMLVSTIVIRKPSWNIPFCIAIREGKHGAAIFAGYIQAISKAFPDLHEIIITTNSYLPQVPIGIIAPCPGRGHKEE